MKTNDTLWLGTGSSFEASVIALAKIQAAQQDGKEIPADTMLEVQGNVGVINIVGSLVNGNVGPWGAYFGVTGYGDIAEGLIAALQNPEVGSIILNVASGGGQVAGCADCAALIARVDKLKPVITYTGDNMHSAALWLGTSGREVVVSNTAMFGSLGIIMIHKEYTGMMAADGIKATVIRAGKFKALATPYEVLPEAAKEKMQAQAETFYDIFLDNVAANRGMPSPVADKKFGQGLEFIGQAGVDVGLADRVGSYEDAHATASKLAEKTLKKTASKSLISHINTTNNAVVTPVLVAAVASMGDNSFIAQGNSMPKPYSAEDLAAIAAGIQLPAPEASATGDAPATPAAPVVPANPPVAPHTPAATLPAEPTALAVLQGMLTEAQASVVAANSALATAHAETATARAAEIAAKAEILPFVEIARASVRTMGVALGGSGETAAALSAPEVLAEHNRLKGVFQDKFKAGAHAAPGAKSDTAAAKASVPLAFVVNTPKK